MRQEINRYFVLLCIFLGADSWAGNLTISIEDLSTDEGHIAFQVFSSAEQFTGEAESIISVHVTAEALSGSFIVSDLPDGYYGIRVMHDVNSNNQLDTNFVGMPNEPYGFSNNAKGNFGPPMWDDIKFQLNGDRQQTINLDL